MMRRNTVQNGTIAALRKYDKAFQQAGKAAAHEIWDTSATQPVTRRVSYTQRVGLFGVRTFSRLQTVYVIPHWHGHCNGWTSAAIRHAEPESSVKRNGVTFSPSDIKLNQGIANGWEAMRVKR